MVRPAGIRSFALLFRSEPNFPNSLIREQLFRHQKYACGWATGWVRCDASWPAGVSPSAFR